MKEIKRSLFSFLSLVTLSLLFYSWAMNRLSQEEELLLQSCVVLQEKLDRLEQNNHLLKEKISSVGDPSGEDYLLRKELGLCPKNGKRVQFTEWNG